MAADNTATCYMPIFQCFQSLSNERKLLLNKQQNKRTATCEKFSAYFSISNLHVVFCIVKLLLSSHEFRNNTICTCIDDCGWGDSQAP